MYSDLCHTKMFRIWAKFVYMKPICFKIHKIVGFSYELIERSLAEAWVRIIALNYWS